MVLIFLATDGRIIRYLSYGQSHYSTSSAFLPGRFDDSAQRCCKRKRTRLVDKPYTLVLSGHFQGAGDILHRIVGSAGVLTLISLAALIHLP